MRAWPLSPSSESWSSIHSESITSRKFRYLDTAAKELSCKTPGRATDDTARLQKAVLKMKYGEAC